MGLGGNTLNRAPMAAVFEMVRQKKRSLRVVKDRGRDGTWMRCVWPVAPRRWMPASSATKASMAWPSATAEACSPGLVRANEHACYTVISALRAASYGIPFMPVRGLKVSDLRKVNDYFADVTDPFTGETLAAVRAIRPDFAVVHAQIADSQGKRLL